jgi:transposase, IS5 family
VKIEKRRKARIDCTVVESNIHKPFDSMQVFDSVRVISRLLTKDRDEIGVKIVFIDHRYRAKRRMVSIQHAKGEKQHQPLYKCLLKVTKKTIGYSIQAEKTLAQHCSADQQLLGLFCAIKQYGYLARQVYDKTYRRVIRGESVPADQNVFSIFEEHTDIIIKNRRETHFGHKICLTGGASNLLLDCVIHEGKPTDTELVETMLDRQRQI